MTLPRHLLAILAAGMLLLVAGCATRPVNPPITEVDRTTGYRFLTRITQHSKDPQNLVVLAFSGGGTRAAAFSYGVLEALRPMEVIGPRGRISMLDEVDVVTGISGGSFTALAYALYGEKLFDLYETSFLKRNVEGELLARVLSPGGWGDWNRSETAAKLYDDILFHGATFGDLDRGDGPFVVVSATDITSGGRLAFHQGAFDTLCSNVAAVRLARAATASSAVPLVFAPVTLDNYGGTCRFSLPEFMTRFSDPATAPRPAARSLAHLQDLLAYQNADHKPYVHLLDGGLSDNLGMRPVLEAIEDLEALNSVGQKTPLDEVRRIIVFIVNSRSSPTTDWYQNERPPGEITLLIKATGVPIDHYSYDSVETMKDVVARWQTMRRLRKAAALAPSTDPDVQQLLRTPDTELYAIDVSFPQLKDEAEREYLNNLPTSFKLSPEAVDRLRAAAATIIHDSPEFKRLLREAGAQIVMKPVGGAAPAPKAN